MISNVHERRIAAPPQEVGALLDSLGSPHDRLWPHAPRDPMVLRHGDGSGLRIGAKGGHGPVRYTVEDYEPGRRVTFRIAPELGLGNAWHGVFAEPTADGGTLLRHELEVTPTGAMRILWPLVVRSMHNCYAEDALDRAERELGVGPTQEHRHSLWARVLERRLRRRVSATAPLLDGLAASALPRVDVTDAFRTDLLPGDGVDPIAWTTAIFSAVPAWVRALMHIRDALVRLVGVHTADAHPGAIFPLHAATATEAVVGIDDRHLDFRLVTTVDGAARCVTMTTVVHLHSRLGRAYWAVVRHFHPVVVRALMRRAASPSGVERLFPLQPAQAIERRAGATV